MEKHQTKQVMERKDVLELSPQELGARGEQLTAGYLERRGYEVDQLNWKCPFGEVDIVAHDGGECVFVEVKTRIVQSIRTGNYPELAVDAEKKRRYVRMAQHLMSQTGLDHVRFDVAAVQVMRNGLAHLHYKVDAFGDDQ